jgi:hypothetical protein
MTRKSAEGQKLTSLGVIKLVRFVPQAEPLYSPASLGHAADPHAEVGSHGFAGRLCRAPRKPLPLVKKEDPREPKRCWA